MTIKHLILPFFLLAFPLAASAADVSNDALIDQLLGDQRGTPDAPARRAELQREIAVQDALIKEAQKQGLTQTPAFMVRMELARRAAIVETYWRAFLEQHPIDPSAVKLGYEQLKAANGGKQYHAHQIFTESEASAKRALDALAHKEMFEAVAGRYSQDRATSAQGGDLGWQFRSNLIGPVADALPKMKPGEVTATPIAIAKGFIILRLDEIRDFPDFELLKPQIENALFQKARQDEVKRLQAAN
jgi:peptidyl-prolyl cis-trans isomerase C